MPSVLFLIRKLQDRIHTLDILNFFRQLAALIAGGITLMQSLKILSQSQEKKSFKLLISSLAAELQSGKEFNQCLQRFPQFFDHFCCHLVKLGEQTGTLETTLQKVAFYKEKNQALRKQIKQAIFYPTLILITAGATTLVMLLLVVPHFAALFAHYPAKIPALTRFIFYLSALLHKVSAWIGILLLGMIGALVYKQKSSTFYQQHILQIPYLGSIIKKILLTGFARHLALTLKAGIPLTEALMMVASLSPLQKATEAILKLHRGIHSGQRFHSTLATHPFFPPLLMQMTRTGEESGTLDCMLDKFADIYEADLEQWLITLNQLLEPLIILILGVLIGGIVIAMYLPIFHLGTVI